ncbi:fibronectin type III domain-containing protein [Paenibacillus xylanexedens]|uniref:fibronectin type III domain-containing protein n=1 Tax=Paenibacillus xylanexedens TaxID=528191 RepID=UPI000F530602|nr:fibronectin type III domain-containing protein [Paenibacillus xylanexedens]RPK20089.1 hypothetical protein EDO6_06624 [Paenibacillus xylanexedens]
MAENQTTETKASKKGLKSTAGVAALAGALIVGGLGGGFVSTQTVDPAPVVDQINAEDEMAIAMATSVTNLQAVAMADANVGPHIHMTWDNSTSAKGFNVYLDGKKVTTTPIAGGKGDKARYMLTKNGLVAGKTYKLTVTVIDANGTESAPSDAVEVVTK